MSHIVLILVIALIFIGPQQLPEVARTLGRLLNELRRASGDLTTTFLDVKNAPQRILRDAQKTLDEPVASATPATEPKPHDPTT
jgi:Sec-independent protein translocase protein TatA